MKRVESMTCQNKFVILFIDFSFTNIIYIYIKHIRINSHLNCLIN